MMKIDLIKSIYRINENIIHFSNGMRPFLIIFYTFYLFTQDMLLFLFIESKSYSLLSIVMASIIGFTSSYAILLFGTLAKLNQYSHTMLPIIRNSLYDYNNNNNRRTMFINLNNHDFNHMNILPTTTTTIVEYCRRNRYGKNRLHTILWRLKIAHLEQEIIDNRIGFNCGGKSALTNYSFILLFLSFTMNLLLLFNLFKNYINIQ